MLNLPAPRFIDQDSAVPIPNFFTSTIVGDSAKLTLEFQVFAGDQIFLRLVSSVLGGEHNQSFYIAQNAPRCEILIPKTFVVASTGTTISLMLQLIRSLQISPAPTARVNINPSPIVPPPTPTIWDFSNGSFQGWVPQGPYVGGLLHVINSSVVVEVPNSQATSAHIITRALPLIAGRTYDFSFVVIGGAATSDSSTLYMTMNGARIGPTVQNITQAQPQTGNGTYTATTTGNGWLGIFNATVPDRDHSIILGNIQMRPRP